MVSKKLSGALAAAACAFAAPTTAQSVNAYLGLGAVYESYIDCNTATYRKCNSTYGEASLTFAF